jgi:hypothetical protein
MKAISQSRNPQASPPVSLRKPGAPGRSRGEVWIWIVSLLSVLALVAAAGSFILSVILLD